MFATVPMTDEMSPKLIGLDIYNNAKQNIGTIKDISLNAKGATGHWQGARDQSTLWAIATRGEDIEDPETVHGTQKAVECLRRPILNNSAPGDAIYEPFSGSGTTIIAAEITGRRCSAMEIDPAYCDVAAQRWQELTGRQAVLDGEDRVFNDIAAARGVPETACAA